MKPIRTAISVTIALATLLTSLSASSLSDARQNEQSPIVLRDLSLLRETITDFDESSIQLSDGRQLGWDEVLKATVAPDRQAEFNNRLEQIGLPLFRLKSRIAHDDWIGAGEIAKPIYESRYDVDQFHPRSGNDDRLEIESEYLVCLATMNCYLAKGQRAQALMPFFRAAILQPNIGDELRGMVGSARIPERDRELMFSGDIMPIWFEPLEVEKVAKQLAAALEPKLVNDAKPAPTGFDASTSLGLRLYLASLKIEQGEIERGLIELRSLDFGDDAELVSWRSVLEARIKQKSDNPIGAEAILDANVKRISGSALPASLYLRGINVLQQSEPTDLDYAKAMLTLLKIPAIYGDQHQELSAAALFQSAEIAKRRERDLDAQKLRDELLRRYTNTYHGRLEQQKRAGHEGSEFE